MRRTARLGRFLAAAVFAAALLATGCSRDYQPSYWIVDRAPERVAPAPAPESSAPAPGPERSELAWTQAAP